MKQLEGEAQHQLIILEAEHQGLTTVDVSEKYGKLATMLKRGEVEEVIVQGIPESWMNFLAASLCDNKQLTKELFEELNIPSPTSRVFSSPDDLVGSDLFDGKKQFVCKPAVGTNGVGVTFDITSIEDVRAYFENHAYLGTTFLLEELFQGYDLRVQAIEGAIVAACIRAPAHVIGNGKKSLQALIDDRKRQVQLQNPANDLLVDKETGDLIRNQGFALRSIIPDGVKIQLKRISNMAQGGHAIDVTDELAPAFSEWVANIASKLGTGYFALDVMCKDHKFYTDGSAEALEINLRAEWMHHTFSEVRTHDLARTVVNALFK